MIDLKLTNSLTRQTETFQPISDQHVGIYTCGPTVYNYVSIGNWRTYAFGDTVVRVLKYLGYQVHYVMNITDVGHLTGDNEGDADIGEDRMEKAKKREGKNAWAIGEYYTHDFLSGFQSLNLVQPQTFCKATDHIKEQIAMVQALETNGYTYKIDDGIYFDVQAYEAAGHLYGQLSTLDQRQAGARVEFNPQKRDPRDFALWKFSPTDQQRDMEWDSPWGKGFPGWHIECSAMSTKYLGNQFDIHIGGEDLRSTHHPNEIAQAEGATGETPFVKYWLHGAFLLVAGGRMGKSLGNAYSLQNLQSQGYSPADLRYFYLTGLYRKQLNFTWNSLKAAQTARRRLSSTINSLPQPDDTKFVESADTYIQRFNTAITDDFNMPEALSVVWELLKDAQLSDQQKTNLWALVQPALGITIDQPHELEIPTAVHTLLNQRQAARDAKDWGLSDKLRDQIQSQGFILEDSASGQKIKRVD